MSRRQASRRVGLDGSEAEVARAMESPVPDGKGECRGSRATRRTRAVRIAASPTPRSAARPLGALGRMTIRADASVHVYESPSTSDSERWTEWGIEHRHGMHNTFTVHELRNFARQSSGIHGPGATLEDAGFGPIVLAGAVERLHVRGEAVNALVTALHRSSGPHNEVPR